MFKHGYKYRVKSYEELLKEKDITKDGMGTIFKKGGYWGFSKDTDDFKNTLLSTNCVEGTRNLLLKKFKGEVSYEFFCESWMCECLGEIIEPILKFEVGKTYRVMRWEELLRVKEVVFTEMESGTCKIKNEVIDGNYVIKPQMHDNVFGKDLIVDKEEVIDSVRGTILFGGWEISPWMCKEVEVKEKTKEEKQCCNLKEKRYYSLSEVIEQLSNNSNLAFMHPISKTELTKNIAGIELINPQEVLFTEGWEKKPEPVDFQEAVAKGTKFRVEHEILEMEYPTAPPQEENIILNTYIEKFLNKEYLPLAGLMLAISWNVTGEDLQDIIKEGKWFYE